MLRTVGGMPHREFCYSSCVSRCYEVLEIETCESILKLKSLKWNCFRIDPSHSNAWSNLLVVMDELHECPEVVLLSERALEYGRGKAAIHSQIGSCLAQVGELEKAEVQLLTAIRLSPHVALYQANLGQLWSWATFKPVITLYSIINMLIPGILYQRWRRFDLAEKLYRQALALDENSTAIRDNLQNLVQRNRNGTRFQWYHQIYGSSSHRIISELLQVQIYLYNKYCLLLTNS